MKKNVRIVFLSAVIALFAAIICVGCFIKIPVGIVPIVLQNALCILTGTIIGGYFGGLPTLLFVLAGIIGLPVFAGGTSGIGVILGPTGGFYPGYILGAVVAGFIAGRPKMEKGLSAISVVRVVVAMIAGMVVLYIPGVWRFAVWATGAGKVPADSNVMAYTMGACVIPFIPGDVIKTVVSIPIALGARKLLAMYIGVPNSSDKKAIDKAGDSSLSEKTEEDN